MIRFFEPLLCLCFGIGLTAFGLIHAAGHVPAASHLHDFWAAMPSLGALLLFMLGVVSVISGLGLLSFGTKGLRRRYRQLRHTYARPEYDPDGEEDGYPRQSYAYR